MIRLSVSHRRCLLINLAVHSSCSTCFHLSLWKSVCQPIYLSILPTIPVSLVCLSINSSLNPPIGTFVFLFEPICLSKCVPVNHSVTQFIISFVCTSTQLSFCPSVLLFIRTIQFFHPCIRPSVHPSIRPYVHLPVVSHPINPSVFMRVVYPSVSPLVLYPFVTPSVHLSVSLSVHIVQLFMSNNPSVNLLYRTNQPSCMFFCLPVWISVHQSVYQFVCSSICLSFRLSLHMHAF
jgi:hypothetical protein